MGGATAIPYLKLAVPSIKGTALFWHNLKHTGSDEIRMKHAGCPVLIGTKTVINKWIHSFEQEFRRPCLKTNNFQRNYEEDFYHNIF